MFVFPDAAAKVTFTENVRSAWPGGEYVVEHLDDGPYRLMAVQTIDRPNWLLQAALDAYPHARLPSLDWAGGLDAVMVYLLPKFAYALAEYWTDEYSFQPDPDREFEPCTEPPTPAELEHVLVDLLNIEDNLEHTEHLVEIVNAGAGAGLARLLLRAIDANDRPTVEELTGIVAAFHTALQDGSS